MLLFLKSYANIKTLFTSKVKLKYIIANILYLFYKLNYWLIFNSQFIK